MLKRGWGAESNGKLLHPLIPRKTATSVTEFQVEDLPLGRLSDDDDDDDDDDIACFGTRK